MNLNKNGFPQRNSFFVVVHVQDRHQALRNAHIGEQEGADGIFLINHDIGHTVLLDAYDFVRQSLPDFWIGLNCLDLGMDAIDVIPKTANGLWIDNAGIREHGPNEVSEAEQFTERRSKSGWKGLYFGGVAFKYQATVKDFAKVARRAMPFVDIITTSGEGTGKAADIQKIIAMKEEIGNHHLAIASGVTPENVSEYILFAHVLAATGISFSHTELNPRLVGKLARGVPK